MVHKKTLIVAVLIFSCLSMCSASKSSGNIFKKSIAKFGQILNKVKAGFSKVLPKIIKSTKPVRNILGEGVIESVTALALEKLVEAMSNSKTEPKDTSDTINMAKVRSYLKTHLNPDLECMQLHICKVVRDCKVQTTDSFATCTVNSLKTILVETTTISYNIIEEAIINEEKLEDCEGIYRGCRNI